MQFNDTTNNSGIIQECEDMTGLGDTGISGNTNRLKTFTRWVNEGFSKLQILIINADGRMQWDDPNHADRPIATADLVSGQGEYELFSKAPSASQDWLTLQRIDIADSDGNFKKLKEIDKNDVGEAWDEFMDTNSIPVFYEVEGSSIILKPAPDYSYTDGLKYFFTRVGSYFSYSDTTKVAGINTLLQPYLPMYASYKWGISKGKDVRALKRDLVELENSCSKIYSKRNKDGQNKLSRVKKSYK